MPLPDPIVETIMGIRCPCGHLIDEEHEPTAGLPCQGLGHERCGPCEVDGCECRGLID